MYWEQLGVGAAKSRARNKLLGAKIYLLNSATRGKHFLMQIKADEQRSKKKKKKKKKKRQQQEKNLEVEALVLMAIAQSHMYVLRTDPRWSLQRGQVNTSFSFP